MGLSIAAAIVMAVVGMKRLAVQFENFLVRAIKLMNPFPISEPLQV